MSSLEVGADAPRWRARWTVAALGLGAFVLLVGLEVATEDEAVKPLDVLGDAVQIAVLVLTAIATGWLAVRVRSPEYVLYLHGFFSSTQRPTTCGSGNARHSGSFSHAGSWYSPGNRSGLSLASGVSGSASM